MAMVPPGDIPRKKTPTHCQFLFVQATTVHYRGSEVPETCRQEQGPGETGSFK